MNEEMQKLGHKIVNEIKSLLIDMPTLGSVKNLDVAKYPAIHQTTYRVTLELNNEETLSLIWNRSEPGQVTS